MLFAMTSRYLCVSQVHVVVKAKTLRFPQRLEDEDLI